MMIARRCALIVLVLALAGSQAACMMFYKRPDVELEAASTSISSSKEVCADVYASDTFAEAQDKLKEAQVAADQKEKGAKELALEAKELAEKSKAEAIRRGDEARATTSKNLAESRDVLANVDAALSELGEDEGGALFVSRMDSLRDLEVKIETQLRGAGCGLLAADEGSKTLLSGANELSADVESYSLSVMAEQQKQMTPILHSVVQGECLWCIAGYSTVYADPFLWPLIYSANRNQIEDPDLIFPGQVFEIPKDSTDEEKAEARHEARTRGPWSLYDGR
jgi:nucleoid-associated protein YgaU